MIMGISAADTMGVARAGEGRQRTPVGVRIAVIEVELTDQRATALDVLSADGMSPPHAGMPSNGGLRGSLEKRLESLSKVKGVKVVSNSYALLADRVSGSISSGVSRVKKGRKPRTILEEGTSIEVRPEILPGGSVNLAVVQTLKKRTGFKWKGLFKKEPEYSTQVLEVSTRVKRGHYAVVGGLIHRDKRRSIESLLFLEPVVNPAKVVASSCLR